MVEAHVPLKGLGLCSMRLLSSIKNLSTRHAVLSVTCKRALGHAPCKCACSGQSACFTNLHPLLLELIIAHLEQSMTTMQQSAEALQ